MPPSKQDLRSLSNAFRALSNPNRLAMYVELLRRQETEVQTCALQSLINRIDIGAPTVSHHTRELVQAGLITVEREGKHLRCRLNESMRRKLAGFFGVNPD